MNDTVSIKIDFTSTEDSWPEYGEPVLIIIDGILQHITYMLSGADDEPDLFEPYYFISEDDLKISTNEVESWAYIPVMGIKCLRGFER